MLLDTCLSIDYAGTMTDPNIPVFTITADILARLLANFYRQKPDSHMNLQFIRFVNERERTICSCKKQIGVSVPCVCPVIDNEFRHNIIKVVSGSTIILTMVFMKFMIKNRTDA